MSMRTHWARGRHLDAGQLLHREAVGQLVEEGREVVHAGHVGGALLVHQLLAGLFHARVQVADDRFGTQHLLAPISTITLKTP